MLPLALQAASQIHHRLLHTYLEGVACTLREHCNLNRPPCLADRLPATWKPHFHRIAALIR